MEFIKRGGPLDNHDRFLDTGQDIRNCQYPHHHHHHQSQPRNNFIVVEEIPNPGRRGCHI